MRSVKIQTAAPLLALALLTLTGCGGGGGSETTGESAVSQSGTTTMITGRSYAVYEGDRIEKRAPGTVVTLESDLRTGETSAVLQSGEAVLIRR